LQRTCFLEPRLRDQHVAIGSQGALDQGIQARVLKAAPEAGDVGRNRLGIRVCRASRNEGRIQFRRLGLVVRTDGGTAT